MKCFTEDMLHYIAHILCKAVGSIELGLSYDE